MTDIDAGRTAMKRFDYDRFHHEVVCSARRTEACAAGVAAALGFTMVFALVIAPAIAAWFQQVPA